MSKVQKKKISNTKTKSMQKSDNTLIWLLLVGALLTTFVIYFKVIHFPFIYSWDDTEYVVKNQYIQSLNLENFIKLWTSFFVANYQPLTMSLYSLTYFIGSGSPSAFHGLNILIHLINSYLVFVLIREISPKNNVVALITAAFFAIHPMHIESVAWISELKDVLFSFFFLLGLIQYKLFLTKKHSKLLVYAFIFFSLSCLSKSAAVVFPLVLLLFDYYSDRKMNLRIIIEKVPFFVVSLIIGIVAFHSQKEAMHEMAPTMTLVEHIAIVSFSFFSYLLKMIVPLDLSAIYPYPSEIGHTMLPLYYYLSIPMLIGTLFLIWYSRRRGKTIIFGFLFFVVNIVLVLQLIPVGGAVMADRYSYIPYLGLFFLSGKAIEALFEYPRFKSYSKSVISCLFLIFFVFAYIANERTKVWESDDSLFSDTIAKYPKCHMAYFNRAAGKDYANNLEGALQDYSTAITLNKDYIVAYTNRGVIKCQLNNFDGAMSDFNYVIQHSNKDIKAYFNRGLLYNTLNKFSEAIPDFDDAIRLNSRYAEAFNNRGVAYFNLRNFEFALNDWNKAIEIDPNFAMAIRNRDVAIATLNGQKVN